MKTIQDVNGNQVPYMSLGDLVNQVKELVDVHGEDIPVCVEIFMVNNQIGLGMPGLSLDTIKYKHGDRKVVRISYR